MALFGGPSTPVSRLEELKRLLQKDPTSRQFLALAEEYRRHGKYRDAVITLERGLAMHQTSVAGHVALGKTYQQLDRLEDAIRAFTNALRIDRENLVAIRQLAEACAAFEGSEQRSPATTTLLNAESATWSCPVIRLELRVKESSC